MPRSRQTAGLRAAPAAGRRRAPIVGAVVAALAMAAIAAVLFRPSPRLPAAPPAGAPEFVGQAACAGCHRDETEAWRGSQHAQAMQPATPATVLGRFDDTPFTYGGVTSTFFRKDDRYFVHTDGP